MKQINYIMKVKYAGSDDSSAWEENMAEYVDDNITEEENAKSIVDNYNKTLRAHEQARELVCVKSIVSDKKARLVHDWHKVSLVTEKGGYDKMKCNRCGCTGKRYGLGTYIKLDKKFDKPKFQDGCPVKL